MESYTPKTIYQTIKSALVTGVIGVTGLVGVAQTGCTHAARRAQIVTPAIETKMTPEQALKTVAFNLDGAVADGVVSRSPDEYRLLAKLQDMLTPIEPSKLSPDMQPVYQVTKDRLTKTINDVLAKGPVHVNLIVVYDNGHGNVYDRAGPRPMVKGGDIEVKLDAPAGEVIKAFGLDQQTMLHKSTFGFKPLKDYAGRNGRVSWDAIYGNRERIPADQTHKNTLMGYVQKQGKIGAHNNDLSAEEVGMLADSNPENGDITNLAAGLNITGDFKIEGAKVAEAKPAEPAQGGEGVTDYKKGTGDLPKQ
jgi:hypothetical protein